MTTGIQTPQEAIAAASAGGAKIVDIRFTDLFGIWQHFSIPAREFTPELFDEGIGFDGSSVRGFQEILAGKHDDLPEQAFYMVGTIDEAREKGAEMAAAAG